MAERRARRRIPGRDRQQDTGAGLLLGQIVICAAAVAVALGLSTANPMQAAAVSPKIQLLMTAEKVTLPEQAVIAAKEQGVLLWNRTRETVLGWIELLLRDNRHPAAVQETAGEELNGVGGWTGTDDQSHLPASCSLAPLFCSAQVEPPVSGRVTSFYGFRIHPLTAADDFHRGLDIAAPSGAGIHTPLPGRVAEIGESAIYGNYVTLDHGNGCQTTYCHCAEIIAEQGANLRKGELIARVGSTGISTGPHLHFEVQKNGVYFNPAWVVDGMEGYGI